MCEKDELRIQFEAASQRQNAEAMAFCNTNLRRKRFGSVGSHQVMVRSSGTL